MHLSDEQRAFVDSVGLFYEARGLPRNSGLVLGYFLICEPGHQTAAQIQEALGISSGSISTVVRKLEGLGFLERKAIKRDRSRYYRVSADAWARAMQGQVEASRLVADLAGQGLRVVSRRSDAARRLQGMKAFHTFMAEQLPALIQRWKARR